MSRYRTDDFVAAPSLWTSEELQEFNRRVTAAGHNPRHYRIERLHLGPHGGVFGGSGIAGQVNGVIRITNIITDREREYSVDETSEKWFLKASADIETGEFD